MFEKLRIGLAKLLVGELAVILPTYSTIPENAKWDTENYCRECLNTVDPYHKDFECACLVCGSQQCLSPMSLRSHRLISVKGAWKYQFRYPGNPESLVTVSVDEGIRMKRGEYKKEETCS